MVTAGDKYLDVFPWGEIERYHTLKAEGRILTLLERISIITNDENVVEGEITYIAEYYVEIRLDNNSHKKIKFKDIKTIYR